MNISENSKKVLFAALDNIQACTAGQFGFSDEVHVDGISEAQKAGHFSDLNKKGLLISWTEDDHDTQITPTEDGVKWAQANGYPTHDDNGTELWFEY